jgi:ribosomal protein S18 acetylase RimI-like enzyme
LVIRPAVEEDASSLAALLAFEFNVHRHLDWRPVIEWLPHPPFYIGEQGTRLVASLALPPDPPGVYWIRLYACAGRLDPQETFDRLFAQALSSIDPVKDNPIIASLAGYSWFRRILESHRFSHHQDIVVLRWEDRPIQHLPAPRELIIRPCLPTDLNEVCRLDNLCFERIWQLSLASLDKAYSQSGYATVAELGGRIIAYQLTSENPLSAHLARIAVHPDVQGQHIASAILNDMLEYYLRQEIWQVTVNTQSTNQASLALYQKSGFEITDERYPVYLYNRL